MQMGFYFDQTRCTGCMACRVACKDWHDVPAGPENWMRVHYAERGRIPDVFVSYLISPCWHCGEPVCAEACPVDAITKREEDGIVVVASQTCLGNEECDEKCRKACPYGAPQFGPEPGAKMRKCNYCLDRRLEGRPPTCVEACPTRAMDAGPLAELQRKYGPGVEADQFAYSKRTRPSVVMKPKKALAGRLPARGIGRPPGGSKKTVSGTIQKGKKGAVHGQTRIENQSLRHPGH